MADRAYVMGLFESEHRAADVIGELKAGPWRLDRVHSPIPSETLSDALNLKKSPVGYFTLIGGIIGFFFGFLLAIFTATRWNIIVGGKPIVALVPFFIVGFEFTVLFAVFGNVIGMITQSGLPNWKGATTVYDERLSGRHYGVLASCERQDEAELIRFFEQKGGEARAYDR
jgi:hypothetical protein